ncbi:MAG: VanZ family protein [Firmicutes bacterium]|nr:VanZ family protein [Bacillota bacterium]
MEAGNKSRSVHLLLGIYCILLVWIILFKLSLSWEEVQSMIGTSEINFIPFGTYLSMLCINGKKAVFLGFIFSFALEFTQYIFHLGSFDITDLIMNTAGTAVGVLIYFLLRKVFRSTKKTNKILTISASVATVLGVTVILLLVLLN